MRIYEIRKQGGSETSTLPLSESTDAVVDEAIRSVIIPLKAQGVTKVTVKQIMDTLEGNNMLSSIGVDETMVVNRLAAHKAVVKVQTDPDNEGAMTAYLSQDLARRVVRRDEHEKEQKKIKATALKAIRKKLK